MYYRSILLFLFFANIKLISHALTSCRVGSTMPDWSSYGVIGGVKQRFEFLVVGSNVLVLNDLKIERKNESSLLLS